uniref:Uncharacterized protein YjbI, contains pentapeptide repeats n=1 Tax=Candidatus Kentrum sp. TC TaxID=2126339 RepID=A0A450ZH26_9GAMM|nr:MAG: Uncharacterized protein YjbI, contains pentapeptide repeats [Candidatus Kentron sp. TC]VFK53123.1 MAG: Uncharacterized protein YjbI, contains pentapeptide repeats [Candidatus Kentron sp. TC]
MKNSELLSLRNVRSRIEFSIPRLSPPDKERSLQVLKSHAVVAKNDWRPAIGSVFRDKNFAAYSMKRGIGTNCTFYGCDFSRSAGTASRWKRSRFVECNFNGTNYDYAVFDDAAFIYESEPERHPAYNGAGLSGASFSGASFRRAQLINAYIRGTALTQIDFRDAEITDCHIQSCTLEGSDFSSARLIGLNLGNLNLEYCDFTDARFEKCRIALMQFPFIFGISEQSIRQGILKIQTDDEANYPNGTLPWNDLLKLIPNLVAYYQANNNYFPICNLYLASGRVEEFSEYLNLGLRDSIARQDFRTTKFLSKLAKVSRIFTSAQLTDLYELIRQHSFVDDPEPGLPYAYRLHEGEIRSYLTLSIDEDELSIGLVVSQTTSSRFASDLDTCLRSISMACVSLGIQVVWRHVTISRNSPYRISFRAKVVSAHARSHSGESRTNFLQMMAVVFAGVSAVSTTLSASALWYNNLSVDNQQAIERTERAVSQHFVVQSLTINRGNSVYLVYEDERLTHLSLQNSTCLGDEHANGMESNRGQ